MPSGVILNSIRGVDTTSLEEECDHKKSEA